MGNKIKLDYSRNSLFDEIGITRLKDSYMMENEIDPQERFAFVSKSFATNEAHAQRLYDYSSKHWLSYSTPILSFGRSKKGLPISCYLNYIEDTTEGLVDNLTETNWLSVLGGGVGVHMGIRGVDEESTGLMPHIKTYEASCQAYKQGRTRRGSYAIDTDISHPDIIQFLEMRKPTGDPNLRALHLNRGINIPDSFMELLTKAMGDETIDDSWPLIQPNTGQVVETVSAKELWAKIIELRANTGEPYLWFIDAANRGLPDYQQSAGLRNNGSNLCVAPETFILTDSGYKEIGSLQDAKVKVWNGIEFSEVEVVKTGENQKLISVILDNGMSVDCTLYHKFYVKNHYDKKEVEVKASDLKVGDKLSRVSYPTIEGNNKLELAYQNGFFTGDGCFFNNENIIYLYGNKRELINYFLPYSTRHSIQEAQDREVLIIPNLQDKFFVPNAEYSITSRLEWLAGLLDADSVVCKNGKSQTIQLSSINFGFLQNVQRMLHTLGTSSTIKIMHLEGIRKLPKNDGTGNWETINVKLAIGYLYQEWE